MAAASMDLSPVFQAAGQEWNVDPALLQSLAGQETGGLANPDGAVSPKGATGRMQIMPGTAQDLGVTNPNDPVQSIYGAAKYMSQLLDRYQDTSDPVSTAIAAYNAGPGRVDDVLAGKNTLPAETVAYVPGVASRYKAFTGGANAQSNASPASSTTATPSLDDTATAGLNAGLARLQGGSQSASAPIATPSTPSPAASGAVDYFDQAKASAAQAPVAGQPGASVGGPVDYFSLAKAAALGTPGATPAPAATQPPTAPVQVPAGGQQGATGATGPVDYFSMAKAAALAAPGASQQSGGAVTSVSAPGTAQTSPGTAQTPSTLQAQTGYTIPYLGTQLPSVTNLAEGAGHAVLDASRALYGAIDYGNKVGPAALAPDGSVIDRVINPSVAIPNLNAENAQYAASGVGNTVAGQAGNLVGQTALTLPVLGGVGVGTALTRAGGALAAGVDAVSPVAGSVVRGAGRFLAGSASVPDNAVANAVVRPASLAANGAVQGATVNLLTGDPGNTAGQNMLMGGAAGAVLGPVGAAAGRLYSGATGLIQPLTSGGRNAIADTALAKMALDGGGPLTADTTTLVPGSSPTLAQATGNAGLAGAERAVASIRPQQFTTLAQQNNEARTSLVNQLTGTPTDIETAETARDTTALPAILNPITNATAPADASPVVSTIDQILASPAGQRDAVQSALGNIRSKLTTPIPFGDRVDTALNSVTDAINSGNVDPGLWAARDALVAAQSGRAQQASTLARLQGTTSADPAAQAIINGATNTVGTANLVESDPAQLYGIRKAIGDALSPLAARTGSDAQLAASELQQVKAALDNSIEGAAPGFKQGLADYADSSRPIDAMRYLQSKKYTTADDQVTLAKVTSALDDITKQQALPGPRDAKSVPQATIDSLQSLRADLLRQNNSRLGMQPGSNTFQNLGTAQAMSSMGAPLGVVSSALGSIPGVNLLAGGLRHLYSAQDAPILDAVVNRLANPQAGQSVLKRAELLRQQRAAGPSGANKLLVAPGVNLLTGSR